jgi:ABC-type branched-subunit amino acid transport system ATPase component/ABC-type branched-subunit amino acid transport system permease subunit
MSRRWVRVLVAAAVMAALPPILSRAAPGVFTDLRALTLGIGLSYAALAISLNLLMGYAGQISLGHAALLGVGAFTSGVLTDRFFEGPMVLGVVAAAAMGALIAFLLGLPALRLRGLYLAVVTIGFGLMMQESVFRWGPLTGGGSAGLAIPRPWMGGHYFAKNADYLAILVLLFVLVWVVDANVVRTKFGRAFRVIRENEEVAQSFGVSVARYKLTAFVLSGALAGVAGAMFGHLIGFVAAASFSYALSLQIVVMVVVGGLGSRLGVTIAAVAFTFLPRIFGFLNGWDQLIGALLLIDVMARHPGGFAQVFREARERRLAKARDALAVDEQPVIPRFARLEVPEGIAASPVVAGDTLLTVEGVSVRFGGLQALDRVSIEVPKRAIVGLIGPNGAGKSTLFNAVSGFVRPDEGAIRFRGEPIHDVAPDARARMGIGRTFQLIGLAKAQSVRENLLLAQHQLAVYGVPGALMYAPWAAFDERVLAERADASIEALGFARYADTPVGKLSHGQQRIVEIACSLVTEPEVLLLDEPSAGMAPALVENLAERLGEIRSDLDRTILLIEHNIPLVLEVCDYIYVLNFGEILAEGTTADIARRPEVIAAYFGESVDAPRDSSSGAPAGRRPKARAAR